MQTYVKWLLISMLEHEEEGIKLIVVDNLAYATFWSSGIIFVFVVVLFSNIRQALYSGLHTLQTPMMFNNPAL
jgi:hypothetical protein